MEKVISFMCFIFISSLNGYSQEVSKYYVEIGTSIGIMSLNDSDYELSTRDLSVSFGYYVSKRFSAKIPFMLSTGLLKNDKLNTKSYDATGAIGLGVGYNFILKPTYKIQLSGEVGNTLSKSNDKWSFFYYDAGCKLYLGETSNRSNAIVGLGIKQMFFDEKQSTNYLVPYVSIGFRLNSFKRK